MNEKPISPKAHGILDYVLVGSLLTLPTLLGLNKKVKGIYAAEAFVLLGYVAVSDHPAAIKPMIPFEVYGKIDPFNVVGFAAQTFLPAFGKEKKAVLFNAAFTLMSAVTVLLTHWSGKTNSATYADDWRNRFLV